MKQVDQIDNDIDFDIENEFNNILDDFEEPVQFELTSIKNNHKKFSENIENKPVNQTNWKEKHRSRHWGLTKIYTFGSPTEPIFPDKFEILKQDTFSVIIIF